MSKYNRRLLDSCVLPFLRPNKSLKRFDLKPLQSSMHLLG